MRKLSELTIEIIQRCPNRCLHCSSLSSPHSPAIISRESVLHVARQAKELGLERICLSGGEPLLHPELKEIVEGITRLGLSISFYTTGVFLNPDGSVDAHLDWSFFPKETTKLMFSVQSCRPETHDKISGRRGAFSLTKEALLSACYQGYWVETHIVPNKINLNDLEETVRTADSWGVSQVSFLRLVPQGNASGNIEMLAFDQKEEDAFKEIALRLEGGNSFRARTRFGIPFSGQLAHVKKCNAAETKLIIRYDGKILPCEAFKDSRFDWLVLGDIEADSLEQALACGECSHALIDAKGRVAGCESCPAQMLYS